MLADTEHTIVDVGTDSTASVDYPDYAAAVGRAVIDGRADRGIVVCGSGAGAAIAANKLDGIRCAQANDTYTAHQAVEHDDVNVIALAARVVGPSLSWEIVESFLGAEFIPEGPLRATPQQGPRPRARPPLGPTLLLPRGGIPLRVLPTSASRPMTKKPPESYLNRELSLLDFQERVLSLANATISPCSSGSSSLAIVSQNLDEFFQVRVAGLINRAATGGSPARDGMTPRQQLAAIHAQVLEINEAIDELFLDELLPALDKEGIRSSTGASSDPRIGPFWTRPSRSRSSPCSPLGRRPIPSLSLHLQPVAQPCRRGAQPGEIGTPVRSGQGAAVSVALHRARRRRTVCSRSSR